MAKGDGKEIKRISNIMSPEEARPPIHKAADFANVDLLVTNIEYMEGNLGDFYLLTCTIYPNGDEILISSGAAPVKKQLEAFINSGEEYPIIVKFVPSGRSWVLE